MKRCLTILFLFFISYAAQAQPQLESAQEKLIAEAKKGGYQLITLQDLEKEYLSGPSALLLVDTRQEWAYQMQHITGAAHLSVTPTWWYQYSPSARSDMRRVLGPELNKKIVFY